MEDDNEFGDRYTDVLKSFASSSALQSNPTPTSHPYSQPQPSNPFPIDINLNIARTSSAAAFHPGDSDNDADVLRDASNPNFASCSAEQQPRNSVNLGASPPNNPKGDHAHVQDPMLSHETRETPEPVQVSLKLNPPAEASSRSRVLENDDDLNLEVEDIAALVDEAGAQNFGIEEASAVEEDDRQADDLSLDPVIPGLDFDAGPSVSNATENENFMGRGEDGYDDWNSDCDDDLQIVLNDDHHHLHDPMAMDRNGMEGSNDEDEDGDPLIIVADEADVSHQPVDDQVGGEDDAKATEGERKGADASKDNGGPAMAQKIGYGNYGYHPYHSQFKYVRPGATLLPGGGPGGVPGQVRPAINVGAGAGTGRGRGDWRPAGMKGGPMQKGFHPGFWGGNGSGRGFGGEFTLPSHKTIFEGDIDSFEEKPWNYPGVDVTEFINFGLNEESWKEYCKQLVSGEYCKQLDQLRMESTSQSKVHVLVGSRTEQEYDPDLPSELAAASGIHDPSAENLNTFKPDAGASEIPKETVRLRPPLPIGRAIQVETGSGERLRSLDTRPPRIHDSDAIIEIVLQGSLNDNSTAGDGAADVTNHDVSGEDRRDDAVEGSSEKEEKEYSDGVKEDLPDKGSPVFIHDEVASAEAEGPDENYLGSEKADSSYEKRQTNVNSRERSASMSPGKSAHEREFIDDKEEEPNERVERENSPLGTSSEERAASEDDESFPAETNNRKEKENSRLSNAVSSDILKDKSTHHSPRKQKLISQVEHKTSKGNDDGIDLKGTRSSDNSKATGSSDHRRGHDDIDEEVILDRHSRLGGELKRVRGEDVQGIRRREFKGSLETEKRLESESMKILKKSPQQFQVLVKSHGFLPNRAIAVKADQTLEDLKLPLLPPSTPSSLRSSIYLCFDGRILSDTATISSSGIKPSSVLTLNFKLQGGGGDGGATGAESRDCYLNMYAVKKPDKVDLNEQRLSKWTTCALSSERLKPPCVIDRLGNVFNKESLVKALVDKKLPRQFRHIKRLKDMITIHLTFIPGLEDSNDSGNRFQCPISGLEFNGKYKFFALTKCGHVMSAKAMKEVKSSACLVCHAEFEDGDKISINGSEEEVTVLRERLEVEKSKVKDKKLKKTAVANIEVDVGLRGTKRVVVDNGKFVETCGNVAANGNGTKKFKAVDVAPAHANKKVYASIFTSSRKSEFKETYSCRSLPLGRN